MRDLDMSDVLRDADDMHSQYLNTMYNEFDVKTDPELGELRYKAGTLAREGNIYAIEAVEMIDHILLGRIATSLCEGCLDRTGCDMCCPPDFDWMADAYNREAEENMLGRLLFPNEY